MLFNSIYKILMATRIKDWEVPYTWWIGIEITENHVINVLLRELNNLIHVNEDRELYVDLQLDDWIQPDDDFPVGITTGRILAEDWRPQNWLIINRKTTSGDYSRLITAADGNFYVDLWDWVWRLLWGEWTDCNVRRFLVPNLQETTVWQSMVDWYLMWKYPIVVYWGQSYILEASPVQWQLRFYWIHTTQVNWLDNWTSMVTRKVLYASWDENNEFVRWFDDEIQIAPTVVSAWMNYTTAFTPVLDSDPATKKYVDDGLALKQDKLTAGDNITIDANNVISATVPSALVYKWNVNWVADLPSSWQSVWDTYFVIWADAMYSWDWTQWNYVGGTGISLNDYFNKTTDDSDDITQWSVNLFVTSSEKATWNAKQNALTAWDNITIDANDVISAVDTKYTAWSGIAISNANVISNTAEFDPQNAGSLGQFLKKTNDGYAWADIPWWWGTTYTEWDWIDITNNVISNTAPFEPTNQWSTGQVLKKSGANSYYWANESWGPWNFNPENAWTTGQVLTKTATGYDWETIAWGEWNVKLFTLASSSDTTTAQAAVDWLNAGKMSILKLNTTFGYQQITGDYYFYPVLDSTSTASNLIFQAIPTSNNSYILPNGKVRRYRPCITIQLSNWDVSGIVVDTSEAAREDITRTWVWTQAEYDLLTPETWVIYNIIPS